MLGELEDAIQARLAELKQQLPRLHLDSYGGELSDPELMVGMLKLTPSVLITTPKVVFRKAGQNRRFTVLDRPQGAVRAERATSLRRRARPVAHGGPRRSGSPVRHGVVDMPNTRGEQGICNFAAPSTNVLHRNGATSSRATRM